MAASPYFDRTYFDPSYFDTDSAAVIPPLGGRRSYQLQEEPEPPAPADTYEDEDLFFL